MEYQGPTTEDLVNVAALNRLFIKGNPGAIQVTCDAAKPRPLTDLELSRLAAAPFLLFSFREQDRDYWQRLLGESSQIDLLDQGDPPGEQTAKLQVAGLGFLWQLARRNPYAVRVVSGAPVSWCESLASQTLVKLLQRAAGRGDLLCLRFAPEHILWRRLLRNGVSSLPQLRRASHHCALQAMLTPDREPPAGRIAAAACAMPATAKRTFRRERTVLRTTKV